MAGFQEAGDKNLEQLKEVQEPFWNCSSFLWTGRVQKLVEKLTDAAFFVYEDKGIGRAAARALLRTETSGKR